MALWTKLQRKYVEDIEKNLNIKYDGKPNRDEASLFISKHKQANREFIIKMKKPAPPTGKQIRYIRDIEKILNIKFEGKTIMEARSFISENRLEYEDKRPPEIKMKLYCNTIASAIGARQRQRRQAGI